MIDSLIIDKVFQPLSHEIESRTGWDNFSVSIRLVEVTIVVWISWLVGILLPMLGASDVFLLFFYALHWTWLVLYRVRVKETARLVRRAVMSGRSIVNPQRKTHASQRVIQSLVCLFCLVVLSLPNGTMTDHHRIVLVVAVSNIILEVFSMYFAACIPDGGGKTRKVREGSLMGRLFPGPAMGHSREITDLDWPGP